MKRFISTQLALLMIFSALTAALASCSPGAKSDTATTPSSETASAETEASDSLESRQGVPDGLPEADYGGANFMMLVQEEFEYDAGVEAITGDALDDEIYNRNQRVSDRFNINVKYESGGDYAAMSSKINKTVKAGDDAYDLCMAHIIQTGTDAINGVFYNWSEVPYVDLTSPWYPQYASAASTVNGKLYALVSDAALTSAVQTYCVYFNKNLASDYGLASSDIYSSVRGGTWTIDAMSEYVKLVYRDLNGNGKKDEEDLYGNKTVLFYSFNFLWVFDQPIIKIENDSVSLVLNCEKTVNILNRLYDFYYNQDGVFLTEYQKSKDMFAAGQSLFLMCHFGPALAELRSMEQDYGIIPFPKWDDAQADYKTNIDGSFDVLVIPVTVPEDEIERNGIITQALSADSWKNVMPVFYDVALKAKGTRDAERWK